MYAMHDVVPFTRSGADGALKLSEAVTMMMDCCQFQEYQEEKFCHFLRSNGIAIFLFSMQLDVLRMPRFREKVTTAVKIYGCKSIYGLRRITMRDEAGKLCLLSNATGAFFDLKAGKALKLDPADLGVRFDEAEPMETLPRKIPFPAAEKTPAAEMTVRRSHLDPNGHLTSAMYFALAEDALPPQFAFNRVRLEYKKQIRPGETVRAFRFPEEAGKIVVDLANGSGESCAAAEFSTADLSAFCEA